MAGTDPPPIRLLSVHVLPKQQRPLRSFLHGVSITPRSSLPLSHAETQDSILLVLQSPSFIPFQNQIDRITSTVSQGSQRTRPLSKCEANFTSAVGKLRLALPCVLPQCVVARLPWLHVGDRLSSAAIVEPVEIRNAGIGSRSASELSASSLSPSRNIAAVVVGVDYKCAEESA